MKKKIQPIFLGFLLMLFILAVACKKKEEEPKQPFVLTQEALDNATVIYQSGIIDDPFKAFNDAAQFGSADPTIGNKKRDLYSNGDKGIAINSGTIIVRRAYDKNSDVLINAAIMIKHEEGFNDATNDWEFINNKYDSAVDYKAHPNGMLPDISKTDIRGVNLTNCVNCHKTVAVNNWLFTTR